MHSVTYSPEDDKIRVYFLSRQGDDILAPLRETGFRWAGASECWFAVWSPAREDAAFAAAGVDEYEDEQTTLAERAEGRAERFAGYSENAAQEAERRDNRAQRMCEAMNGQPILVGHHSEKRHRRDYARMWDDMRKAGEARKRSGYWETRAAGSVAWAHYKDKPGVRARRIKTLEAEARKVGRTLDSLTGARDFLSGERTLAQLWAYANASRVFAYRVWDQLDKIQRGELSAEGLPALVADTLASLLPNIANSERWRDHLAGRIAYEREQLKAQGGEALLAPKPRTAGKGAVPLRNMPGGHPMTKAEWAAKHADYKGTRIREDEHGKYRVRVAMVRSEKGGLCLSEVTLTDAPTWAPGAP